ncbi:MAG: prevent-host-death family protein [Acidimicrobiales bacterium]|nr:MAG: prevent-host-death family protein [Acidimicrobiales bacterium]
MRTFPLSEAKTHLSEIVEEAENTHERVTITKHGHPAVVLVSADDLDALEETLHWQSVPNIRKRISEAEVAIEDGEVYSTNQVRNELGFPLR